MTSSGDDTRETPARQRRDTGFAGVVGPAASADLFVANGHSSSRGGCWHRTNAARLAREEGLVA